MANTNSETQIEGTFSNHCDTNIRSRRCNLNFSWTINRYSVFKRCDSTTLKSAAFSAVNDDLKWYLIYRKSSDYKTVHVSLNPDNDDVLGTYVLVTGTSKISLMKPPGCEMEKFAVRSFRLSSTEPNEETGALFIGVPREVQKWIHQDQDTLTILCEITYTKHTDIINTSTSLVSTPTEISESDHSLDFEKIFNDGYFSDVTISIEGKNYPSHKAILSARSPVFNTMFRNDMQENQRNHIVITDIDQKTFEEMMHYIYTGKVKNLEESAFELLPVADKYDLKQLRIMCENVLFKKLSTDNVARILILADMHHAVKLKAHSLRFIKMNHSKCKDFKETDVWNILTTSRPHLMNDLMKIFFDE